MLRRFDDERAVEHIGNARQLLWSVMEPLRAAGFGELTLDLEAAEHRLLMATQRLTHTRVITGQEAEDVPMIDEDKRLKLLEAQKEGRRESFSVPMAEIISRAWQAVAFIEEMRVDLGKHVRQSQARDLAVGAFATALSHLVMGAQLLIPANLKQLPQLSITVADAEKMGLDGEGRNAVG